MGTLNAVYIHLQDMSASTTAELLARLSAETVLPGSEFWGFPLSEDAVEAPEVVLREASQLPADVIWLSFQSVVDAFQFHHWRAGELLRSLVYGCFEEERTWEHVEGKAEPWEREALFSSADLERSLEWAESPAERRELERIWREAELIPGRAEPSLDARECARAVAEHYRLPGWDLGER